jgi:uncharacterized iron-regulated membrane protein
MKKFRRIIFWLHLGSGLTAGVFVFVMCVTGALLAFESNLVEFAESGMRNVSVSSEAKRLSIRELVENANAAKRDAKPSNISIANERNASAVISFGRDGQLFVNPYSGEITGEGSTGWRGFFRFVEDAHRWLALPGGGRDVGKALNDAANFLFLFLAISGLYIWFPKNLTWRNFKPVMWFRSGLRGKSRNFNWHNVIGFWCSLIFVILTLTAVVMSYQWANNLVYTLTGNEVPKQQPRPQTPENPPPDVLPENLASLFQKAEDHGSWKTISLRLPVKQEATFTIDEGIYWNRFGRSNLTVNVANAEITKWEPYGEQDSGRQLRSWVRFTHTGETGGLIGQMIGFIACIGGAFLVWTGFSLALGRFKNWRGRNGNVSKSV